MFVGHLHFLFGKMSLQFFCPFLFFFYKFILFLFISGCVGSLLLRRLSLAAASRGYCLSQCAGFSFWWLLLLWSMGSRRTGFSSCCTWAFSGWGEQGLLFVVVRGLLITVASFAAEHRLKVCGFISYGTQAQQLWLAGSRAQAQ